MNRHSKRMHSSLNRLHYPYVEKNMNNNIFVAPVARMDSVSHMYSVAPVEHMDHVAPVEYVAPVKYMSTAMRTFDAIKIYLRTRSLIKRLSDDQEFFYTEILKSYRLYDVTYMEGLLLKMPLKVDGVMKEYLEKFDVKEKITDFGVDFEEEDFYLKYEGDEKKKYLTTFGAGHQSIFNMVMGNV